MHNQHKRMLKLCFFFSCVLGLLILRLFVIQIVNSERYSSKALQTRTLKLADTYALRGVITDRNYRDLSDSGWQLSKDKQGNIIPIYQRYGQYPLAVHILGHLDFSKESGVAGAEAWFDEMLKAPSGSTVVAEKDVKGRILPGKGTFIFPPVKNKKKNIVLTIDTEIQQIVEDVCAGNSNKNIFMDKGAVVVLDVESGDILASVSRPTFNPNKPLPDNTTHNLINKAFNFYYPGSIFKILVAAAAHEEGLISTKERFYCSGKYTVNSKVYISCWKTEGHGEQTFTEAFANSCNPAFIAIGQRLNKKLLESYIKKFALDRQEIIGYPYIESGNINIARGKAALANASIGQEGIKLTPVQVASIVATIARDGNFITPRLVKEVRVYNGPIVKSFSQGTPQRVITLNTAKKMQELMHQVTLDGRTGEGAWLPQGSAGKTGSAQTGIKTASGKEVVHAWFAGYLPTNKPKYAIVVFAEEGRYGGKAAAPVFRLIGEKLLQREELK